MSEKINFIKDSKKDTVNNDMIQGSREDSAWELQLEKTTKESRAFTFNIVALEMFLNYCKTNNYKSSVIMNKMLTEYVSKLPDPLNPEQKIDIFDKETKRRAYESFYKREFVGAVNRIFKVRSRDYNNRRTSMTIDPKIRSIEIFKQKVDYAEFLLNKIKGNNQNENLKGIEEYINDLEFAEKALENRIKKD